jgi:hypothetical protein
MSLMAILIHPEFALSEGENTKDGNTLAVEVTWRYICELAVL